MSSPFPRPGNAKAAALLAANVAPAPYSLAVVARSDSSNAWVNFYIEAVARSSQSVLITGETGVGKELFSRAVHTSSCASGELVTVNVAGLDDNLFSDTLFGHEKGASTGADRPRRGLIERAGSRTLFLEV